MSNPILYTMPGTCALAPNIAVAWLNAPVTIKTMERGKKKKKSICLSIQKARCRPCNLTTATC
jgi:hypothetical protein